MSLFLYCHEKPFTFQWRLEFSSVEVYARMASDDVRYSDPIGCLVRCHYLHEAKVTNLVSYMCVIINELWKDFL